MSSVRLSVCLSVTLVDQDHIGWTMIPTPSLHSPRVWEGVSPSPFGVGSGVGAVPPPEKKNHFWVPKCVFGCPSECLLMHCNTSRSRLPERLRGLPSLTFQADCGSIKGAGAGGFMSCTCAMRRLRLVRHGHHVTSVST